ncbi:hypothetical protein HanRHA438_Chr15g0723101 [Helianthus annuus]|nr:hypothetical protein HanIR_Chr15g0773561 [Helianthus annuus]KAJ0846279.1 hypothetical protein HanRHA438_Chr15g0723101 [Helianthus annuus]
MKIVWAPCPTLFFFWCTNHPGFFFFLFNESLFGLFPTHNSTQLDTFIIPKLGFHPFRSLKNLKASSSTASHYYQSAIQDLPKVTFRFRLFISLCRCCVSFIIIICVKQKFFTSSSNLHKVSLKL